MGMLKRPSATRSAVEARIRDAITQMRPLLHIDTCGIELIEFRAEGGVAVLRVEGDCPDCEMSAGMLIQGIEAHLRMRVPEIRQVISVEDAARRDG